MQEPQTGLCAPKRVARVVRAGTRLGTSWLEIAVEAVFSSMSARLQLSRIAILHKMAVAERREAEPTTQHRNEVGLAVRQATIVLQCVLVIRDS